MTETIEYLDVFTPPLDHKLNVAIVHSLIGEPYLFSRHSYGEEMTWHFGVQRPYQSKRMIGKSRGTHVLSSRASGWIMKSLRPPAYVGYGSLIPSFVHLRLRVDPETNAAEGSITDFITAGARVVHAEAFPILPVMGFGLVLMFSDGASVTLAPVPEAVDVTVSVADWELRTPHGTVKVGPGLEFTYDPLVAR